MRGVLIKKGREGTDRHTLRRRDKGRDASASRRERAGQTPPSLPALTRNQPAFPASAVMGQYFSARYITQLVVLVVAASSTHPRDSRRLCDTSLRTWLVNTVETWEGPCSISSPSSRGPAVNLELAGPGTQVPPLWVWSVSLLS